MILKSKSENKSNVNTTNLLTQLIILLIALSVLLTAYRSYLHCGTISDTQYQMWQLVTYKHWCLQDSKYYKICKYESYRFLESNTV